MDDSDFNYFVDSVIVAAADCQAGKNIKPIDVAGICTAVNESAPPTWQSAAAERLVTEGFGRIVRDLDRPGRPLFDINAAGLARAATVRAERRKPTLKQRIAQVNRSDWIALLALLTSIGALFK